MDKFKQTLKKLNQKWPQGFWPGFILGLLYFSYIFSWLWSTYPLEFLGITSKLVAFLVLAVAFGASVVLASLFWGISSFFISKTAKYHAGSGLLPLYLSAIFVINEYLRSWAFGLLWVGNESLVGPHWTFGNVAYWFADLKPIIKSSSVWGIYGVEFILILIFSAIIILVKKGGSKSTTKIIILELLCVILGIFILTNLYPRNTNSEISKISIALIQTNRPTKLIYSTDEVIYDYTKKIELLNQTTKKPETEIVILPENANFSKILSLFLNPSSVKNYFNKLSNRNLVVIDNNTLAFPDGSRSRTLLINSKSGLENYYDKQLLSPGGEYLPYVLKLVFSPFIKNKIILENSYWLKRGADNRLFEHDNLKIKPLVCSDVFSPIISYGDNYNLLVSLQSLGSFVKRPEIIESQFLSSLRFRAAENYKYAVLASNYGHSYVISPEGAITARTNTSDYQILTEDVVPNKVNTWYNRFGDWPILLFSLFLFIFGTRAPKNANKN